MLFALLLIGLATNALCGVPVLVWETNPNNAKSDMIPALSQLDSDDFSNYLVKKVHVHKPLIVLFEEETLSIEDFSWQDSEHRRSFPKLQNLTGMSSKVEFLPSVVDPIGALSDLVRSHDYVWKKYDSSLPTKSNVILEVKMKDPLPNEDRPELLRRHDTDIAEIYSQLLASHSRIVALFTGKHNSWVEVDMNRVRRDVAQENSTQTETKDEPILYENKRIKMALAKEMILKVENETYTLGKTRDAVGIDDRVDLARIILPFSITGDVPKAIIIRPRFDIKGDRWVLLNAEITVGGISNNIFLFPKSEVSAKMGRSFKTSGKVILKNPSGNVSLTFIGMQAELFPKHEERDLGKAFSPADQPQSMFFTAPIWSGLVTSFLLIMILTYGFLMLSDIKTMDRFDDPKGKTIQVGGHEN